MALVVMVVCLSACKTNPKGKSSIDEAPFVQELVDAHNRRVEQLKKTYSDGVIEIRWEDEDGRHFEQGNLDMWIALPRHTSMRVEKLGEVFLWLGSNDQQYWLFDLLAEESVLFKGTHDELPGRQATSLLNIRPMALLDLFALSRISTNRVSSERANYDPHSDCWVIEGMGAGASIRIYFDHQTLLPAQVQSLSDEGGVVLTSKLRRYESVPLPNVSLLAYPKMAELIDVSSFEDSEFQGEVKIAINQTTGIVNDQPFDRVFDLNRLTAGLQPDRIEDQ